MSKTVSARLQDEKHDELRERCNQLGCTMNDFVEASIEYALDGDSDFDFGNDDTDEETPVEEVKEVRSAEEKHESHYDSYGNYWTYDENRKKWTCHLNVENVKIKP